MDSLGNNFKDALTLDEFKSFMRVYDVNECNSFIVSYVL